MEDNPIKNMREYMVSDGKADIDGTLFFCGNAILDIAARLDKLTERVGELETDRHYHAEMIDPPVPDNEEPCCTCGSCR